MADHLYSFERYGHPHVFDYVNIFLGLPFYIKYANYDAIILHYSLLGMRCSPIHWKKLMKSLVNLKDFNGLKIAIPQDEMYFTEDLCALFKAINVHTVYTCAYPIDYQTLYPTEKSGLKKYITTLTGFVDEDSLSTIQKLQKDLPQRDIDIGYRGNNLPFYIGRHGQLKAILAHKFVDVLKNSSIISDISIDPDKVFFGHDWLRFLLRCRTMLGCLGGSGLHDPNGAIRKNTINFIKEHPHATFDEVEEHCFKGLDNTLHLFALSPRHFECAMTKTCQILVEGDYDIFKPSIDYIEIKKDFSNIQEVLEKIKDIAYCEKIAENAFNNIVLSEKYTYRTFVNDVISHIKAHSTAQEPSNINYFIVSQLLTIRRQCESSLDLMMKIWINWNIILKGSSKDKFVFILTKMLPKQFRKLKNKIFVRSLKEPSCP